MFAYSGSDIPFLLRQWSTAKELPKGKQLHAHIINVGKEKDVFLGNLIVRMYGKCGAVFDAYVVFSMLPRKNLFSWNIMVAIFAQNGQLDAAIQFFQQMPEKNLVSWNAMITAYVRHGYDKEALQLFQQLQTEGFKPNKVTLLIALSACANQAAIVEGQKIHTYIAAKGLELDISVLNALINMYGKCGYLKEARIIFDEIPHRNVVSWNTMIGSYAQQGDSCEALNLYNQMEVEGMRPDRVTFLNVLDACAGDTALQDGIKIHKSIVGYGLECDVVVCNAILNMYRKCGSLENAQSLFKRISRRDIASWNIMVAIYVQHGQFKDALDLFQQIPDINVSSWNALMAAYAQTGNSRKVIKLYHYMKLHGIVPDKITLVSVIHACACQVDLNEGKKIHKEIRGTDFEKDDVVSTAILSMYGKCGILEAARSMFEQMPKRNVVRWNAMIAAYAQHSHGAEAFELFCQMQVEGVQSDRFTFISVLNACTSQAAVTKGKLIHGLIEQRGLNTDIAVGNALVNMYAKCGCLESALGVFNRMPLKDVISWTTLIVAFSEHGQFGKCCDTFQMMPEQSVISWNALIAAHVQHGHHKEAAILFQKMQMQSSTADKVTFITMLSACSSSASVAKGKQMHTYIIQYGYDLDASMSNAVINMYWKCGSLDDVQAVFERIPVQDGVSWGCMIAAYSQYGHARGAIKLFQEMKLQGVMPDMVTIISVIHACSQVGLANEGCHYFGSMVQDYGLVPIEQHYNSLADLLGRSGLIDEAESVITSMPFMPSDTTWTTLISANLIHVDFTSAECTSQYISKLASGAHIIEVVPNLGNLKTQN